MTDRQIRVLVVDDSKVSQMFLVHILESDPEIRIVGVVSDGQAALDFVREHVPDVILMDLHMPRLDGFEATRRIMETQPVPIVICSATAAVKDVITTFRAMEAGAVACIAKPLSRGRDDFEAMAAHLLETVKLMAEVRVVRRTARSRPALACVAHPAPAVSWQPAQTEIKLIGIGASTGGPPVLQT